MSKIVNKVRVIADFPGYEVGDVLILNTNTGVFNYAKSAQEANGEVSDVLNAFDGVAARLTDSIKQSFTKSDILLYLEEYFEDISIYKMRTPREMEERVHELSAHMKRIKEDDTFNELDKEEAITVWQNMLWEYEWILGRKELYYTTSSPNKGATIEQTLEHEGALLTNNEEITTMMEEDFFIDGNALEVEREANAKARAEKEYLEDDEDSPTEDRTDS
jgi:hypothetical protein